MERSKGNIALLITAAAWGTAVFPLKIVSHDVSALVVVALRYLLAAILLGVYLMWRKQPLFYRASHGLGIGLLLFFFALTITWGAAHTAAITTSFLQEMRSIFVPLLLLVLFRQRLALRTIIGMAITLLGVYVLVGIPHSAGAIAITAATFLAAIQIIAIERAGKSEYPYVLCFQQLMVVGVLAAIAAFVTNQNLAVPLHSVRMLVYLGLVPTLLAYFLQTYGQRLVRSDRASLLLNCAPVFTFLVSIFLQPSLFTGQIAAGLALVMLAVVLGELRHLPHLRLAHIART